MLSIHQVKEMCQRFFDEEVYKHKLKDKEDVICKITFPTAKEHYLNMAESGQYGNIETAKDLMGSIEHDYIFTDSFMSSRYMSCMSEKEGKFVSEVEIPEDHLFRMLYQCYQFNTDLEAEVINPSDSEFITDSDILQYLNYAIRHEVGHIAQHYELGINDGYTDEYIEEASDDLAAYQEATNENWCDFNDDKISEKDCIITNMNNYYSMLEEREANRYAGIEGDALDQFINLEWKVFVQHNKDRYTPNCNLDFYSSDNEVQEYDFKTVSGEEVDG